MTTPLDLDGCLQLADALGESPQTALALHYLNRGVGVARVVGSPSDFEAALIQGDALTPEPFGYGDSAEGLWELLKRADGWDCVNVGATVAPALGEIMAREYDCDIRYYGDVWYRLDDPVVAFETGAARLLTPSDAPLIDAAPEDMRDLAYPDAAALLRAGVAAGVVMDGELVAVSHSTSLSASEYVELGVYTLQAWRNRGFVTAACVLVCRAIQARGLTPVWSAGEDNWASLRVAEKLGFDRCEGRVYVIPQRSA